LLDIAQAGDADMSHVTGALRQARVQLEPWILTLIAWILFAAVPWLEGGYGLSWDALNHHIYLGWTAEAQRFDKDFLGAAYQSFQFPYLYWPVYKLATSGWPGETVGIVLGGLHALVVPALWKIANACIPGRAVHDTMMRTIAVVMALMSGVVLSLLDSSANDLMAAIPFVWALAYSLDKRLQLAGFLGGISIAFKLSNGPLACVLPVLWLMNSERPHWSRLRDMVVGCLWIVMGFAVVYGYWGLVLWRYFGNPVYPFYDEVFAPLRSLTGWSR